MSPQRTVPLEGICLIKESRESAFIPKELPVSMTYYFISACTLAHLEQKPAITREINGKKIWNAAKRRTLFRSAPYLSPISADIAREE